MFVNCSNHLVSSWSSSQIKAASVWGEIKDIPFPNVAPEWSKSEVQRLAAEVVNKIMECNPSAVLCQGEFTLNYAIVNKLKAKGVMVVAACSERVVQDEILEDGTVSKKSLFAFAGFREY